MPCSVRDCFYGIDDVPERLVLVLECVCDECREAHQAIITMPCQDLPGVGDILCYNPVDPKAAPQEQDHDIPTKEEPV